MKASSVVGPPGCIDSVASGEAKPFEGCISNGSRSESRQDSENRLPSQGSLPSKSSSETSPVLDLSKPIPGIVMASGARNGPAHAGNLSVQSHGLLPLPEQDDCAKRLSRVSFNQGDYELPVKSQSSVTSGSGGNSVTFADLVKDDDTVNGSVAISSGGLSGSVGTGFRELGESGTSSSQPRLSQMRRSINEMVPRASAIMSQKFQSGKFGHRMSNKFFSARVIGGTQSTRSMPGMMGGMGHRKSSVRSMGPINTGGMKNVKSEGWSMTNRIKKMVSEKSNIVKKTQTDGATSRREHYSHGQKTRNDRSSEYDEVDRNRSRMAQLTEWWNRQGQNGALQSKADSDDEQGHNTAKRANEAVRAFRMRIIQKELLRGVPTHETMMGWGAHWRENDTANTSMWTQKQGQAFYEISMPVGQLDDFLSHSWSAPFWQKLMGLHTVYNSGAAARAATVGSVCACVLQRCGMLPMWGHFQETFDGTSYPATNMGIWSLSSGMLIFIFVFFFWQRVRQGLSEIVTWLCNDTSIFSLLTSKNSISKWFRPQMVFFDKLCIHQTEAELKRAGIDSLGGFLANSRRMVILWSTDYFTRLWCTFEVAAFFALHRSSGGTKSAAAIHFVPIGLMPILVLLFQACVAVSFLWEAISMLDREESSGMSSVEWLVLSIIAACAGVLWLWFFPRFLRVYILERLELSHQLDTFSIREALCRNEGDRQRIHMTVGRWHLDEDLGDVPFNIREALLLDPNEVAAGLDAFDRKIRGAFKEEILSAFGSEASIPYNWVVTFFSLPILWMSLDFFAASSAVPVEYQVQSLLVFASATFSWMPLCLRVFLELTLTIERRHQKQKEKSTFRQNKWLRRTADTCTTLLLGFVCLGLVLCTLLLHFILKYHSPLWLVLIWVLIMLFVTFKVYPDAREMIMACGCHRRGKYTEELPAHFVTKGPAGDVHNWTWMIEGQHKALASSAQQFSITPLVTPYLLEDVQCILDDASYTWSTGTGSSTITDFHVQQYRSLVKALLRGDMRLGIRKGILVCVEDQVMLRLSLPSGLVLVQTGKKLSNCEEDFSPRLPGVTQCVNEDLQSAIRRALQDLHLTESVVSFSSLDTEHEELEWKPSTDYPGMWMVPNICIVKASLLSDQVDHAVAGKLSVHSHLPFQLTTIEGLARFEWWSTDAIQEKKLTVSAKPRPCHPEDLTALPVPWDTDKLQQFLSSHGIDAFQDDSQAAKPLHVLHKELWRGESKLVMKGLDLLWAADVVFLCLASPEGDVLVETSRDRKLFPVVHRRPHETVLGAIRRLLIGILRLPEVMIAEIGWRVQDVVAQEDEAFHPGIKCLCKTSFVTGELTREMLERHACHLRANGNEFHFQGTDFDGGVHIYEWWDYTRCAQEELTKLGDGLAGQCIAKPSSRKRSPLCVWWSIGSCGPPGVWTEKSVSEVLNMHDARLRLVGEGKKKSLRELAAEIQNRHCTFASDGKVIERRVEVVQLRLEYKDMVFVETMQKLNDGRKRNKDKLPGIKLLQNEDIMQAAKRLLSINMQIDVSALQLNQTIERVDVKLASPTYIGLPTVFRISIVSGTIAESAAVAGQGHQAACADGSVRSYEWKNKQTCRDLGMVLEGMVEFDLDAYQPAPSFSSIHDLSAFLEQHNISTMRWAVSEKLGGSECLRSRDSLSKGASLSLSKNLNRASFTGRSSVNAIAGGSTDNSNYKANAGSSSGSQSYWSVREDLLWTDDNDAIETPGLKSIQDLEREIWRGECKLLVQPGSAELLRVIDSVHVRLQNRQGLTLVDTNLENEGQYEGVDAHLPTAKRRPDESVWNAARRYLSTELKLYDNSVRFSGGNVWRKDTCVNSKAYPGLQTLFRSHTVDAVLDSEAEGSLKRFLLELKQVSHNTSDETADSVGEKVSGSYHLQMVEPWRDSMNVGCNSGRSSEQQTAPGVQEKKKHFEWRDQTQSAEVGLNAMGYNRLLHDDLRRITVPWSPNAVSDLLKIFDVDEELYGESNDCNAKTVSQLAREVLRGDFYFAEVDGKLTRLLDVVALRVTARSGETLFETARRLHSGGSKVLQDLPSVKRLPEEGVQDAAQRICTEVLKVPKGSIDLTAGAVEIIDEELEAPNYPGMRSICRKHILQAPMIASDESVLQQLGLRSEEQLKKEANKISTIADLSRRFSNVRDRLSIKGDGSRRSARGSVRRPTVLAAPAANSNRGISTPSHEHSATSSSDSIGNLKGNNGSSGTRQSISHSNSGGNKQSMRQVRSILKPSRTQDLDAALSSDLAP